MADEHCVHYPPTEAAEREHAGHQTPQPSCPWCIVRRQAEEITRLTSEAADQATAKVVRWLRGIPPDWRADWGLNATEEIADLLESGLWLLDEPDSQGTEETEK